MRKVVETLVDDFTGEESESVQAYTFDTLVMVEGEDGEQNVEARRYSLDASEETRAAIEDAQAKAEAAYVKALGKALGKYVAVAKEVKGKRSVSNYSREESKAMREWGRANGWEVSDRGRIPNDLADAYAKAHDDDGNALQTG